MGVEVQDKYGIDFSGVWKDAAKAALAIVSFKTVLLDSVTAAIQAEQADKKLVQALRARGEATDRNTEMLRERAAAIQETTVFDDDYVKGLQQQALALDVSVERTDDVVRASLALSRALGVDADMAIKAVVKSQDTHKIALRGTTIALDANRDAADQVIEKYGEYLKATDSFADQSAMLVNQVGELQENFGALVISLDDLLVGGDGGLVGELTQWTKNLLAAMDADSVREFWDVVFDGPGQSRRAQLALDLIALEEKLADIESRHISLGNVDAVHVTKRLQEAVRLRIQIAEMRTELATLARDPNVDTSFMGPPALAPRKAGGATSAKSGKPSERDNSGLMEYLAEAQSVYDSVDGMVASYQDAQLQAATDALAATADIEAMKTQLFEDHADYRIAITNRVADEQERAAKETADIQISEAQRAQQFQEALVEMSMQGIGQIAGAVVMAAARGEKGWAKMAGGQIMAQGLSTMWSGLMHAATAAAIFPINPIAAAEMAAAAGVEAALGATAMGIGAGMGGSLRGGGSRGGGSGGGGRGSSLPSGPMQSYREQDASSGGVTQIIYLQGTILRERDAYRDIENAKGRFALGTRHGSQPRGAF